jgi:hypothetical protein
MNVKKPVARGMRNACLLLTFSILSSSYAADTPTLAGDIERYGELPQERQQAVAQALSKQAWRKLPPAERDSVGEACFQRSGKTLGKKSNGQLKVVKDEGEKLILKRAGDYLNSRPPEKVPAHPAAGDIYGAIPTDASRVTRSVKIDPAVVRWHSTGLYAAPGEVVELIFPDEWVGKDLRVQLSGHRDHIPAKSALRRTPASPARTVSVETHSVKVAGAYGGAIYIDTGRQPREEKAFSVKIKNALEAPYFVLGTTDVQTWRNTLRNAPAPYAEFVTDRVAFSFPSAWIRDLDDPTELLEYWDTVVALHDELGGMAHVRNGPERVNVDVQISVGLFHAGYPAQGPQKQCRGMIDVAKLKQQGNWGWFHELGHEAQRRPDKAWGWNNPYTFDGSVEVTVNLFSAHAMDRIGMEQRGGWSWTASADAVEERAHKVLATKKPYPELGAGEKLSMYLLLRDAFGWESIQAVLASYTHDQDNQPDQLPKDNQSRRDEFLIRMSQTTKRNLAPYMQDLWGIPMSPAAVGQVEDLPVWMPEGFGDILQSREAEIAQRSEKPPSI